MLHNTYYSEFTWHPRTSVRYMWPAVPILGVRLDMGARCKFDLAEVEMGCM